MLLKLKNWFSIDNNVNLVRDLLFIFSLLFAMILGLSSCTPVAHAMEVETEPTESTEVEVKEEGLCFVMPSYTIDGTVYSGFPSLNIPHKYTDRIFVYTRKNNPAVFDVVCMDLLDSSDDAYISVSLNSGLSVDICDVSAPVEYIMYMYDGNYTKEYKAYEPSRSGEPVNGSVGLFSTSYGQIVYSTSDIIDASDGSVYYRAFGSFASFMESLGSFGGFILSMWESVADFVTDNPYILLSLLAWLLVMAAGGLLKMFKA